jgi:hypothetical protein
LKKFEGVFVIRWELGPMVLRRRDWIKRVHLDFLELDIGSGSSRAMVVGWGLGFASVFA